MGMLAWLLLGAVAGYLAGRHLHGHGRLGITGHVLVGILGALVGGFLAAVLYGVDPVTGAELRSSVVATIGAAIAIVTWDVVTATPRSGRRPV